MNLKQWLALAEIKPDQPLPLELREALATTATAVRQLALFQAKPDRAAAKMAKVAGLTAGAVETFREEQVALLGTMALEFNRNQPHSGKVEFIQEAIATDLGVTTRTVRTWRDKVMKKEV